MPIESGCDAGAAPGGPAALGALERRLLDEFQRDFPLVPAPFAAIAERLAISEAEVTAMLTRLRERGFVSRVGAVLAPRVAGYSMLAALAVPAANVERIAALVSSYQEVNHNYEREHTYNLWFVVTGDARARVECTVDEIERRSGLTALRLPLERPYHIDLGFSLWN